MSTTIEEPPEESVASLMSGILGDLQRLVEQQFQLTRREIEVELRQRAVAIAVFGLGAGILFLAAIVFCLTVAYLLHWAWLPLWASHAVVAVALIVSGGILVHLGRARFRAIDPCRNPATEIMQENVPWTTPSK
jgi:hypothetical protein